MVIFKKAFVFILFLLCACKSKKNHPVYASLPGYDVANPVMIQLRTNLDEISGIFYYPKDTSVFAIDDEDGLLYKVYVRKQVQVTNWRFSGEGDYEDIVLHDETFYALQSNGNVKAFRFLSKDSIDLQEITFPFGARNEFETLYYDPRFKKIILLCKDCENSGKYVSSFVLDPQTRAFSDTSLFTLNSDDIAEELGIDKVKFQPSCAAVHPITKDVWVISSVNKILVVASSKGKVKEVYELDRRLFKQAEGITFTPSGDLLVSNEAAEVGVANILIFKYKPSLNEKD